MGRTILHFKINLWNTSLRIRSQPCSSPTQELTFAVASLVLIQRDRAHGSSISLSIRRGFERKFLCIITVKWAYNKVVLPF